MHICRFAILWERHFSKRRSLDEHYTFTTGLFGSRGGSIDLSYLSKRRRPAHACRGIESLEKRTLLTVLFDPVFGVETQKHDGSDGKMSQPAINILFWGATWQGTNGTDPHQWNSNNSPDAQRIIDTTTKLIQSTFFDITKQYGADPFNMFVNDTAWYPSEPANPFDASMIDDRVNNAIDNGFFPEPDADSFHGHPPIYLVVTPTNVNSSEPAAGFNTDGSDFDLPADSDTIPEIWTSIHGTNGDSTVNTDKFSKVLSHEIGEIMTDEGEHGFEVNTPPAWATGGIGGDDQIGDKEGNSYLYRMNNGVVVQALGQSRHAWAVTDGTAQTINIRANWNLTDPTHPTLPSSGLEALTINGDQWLNINDQVTITTAADNSIVINLNGETYNFDAGQLGSIKLNLKAGTNTVILNGKLPDKVSLDMSAAGGSIDLHGPAAVNNWTFTGPNKGTFTSADPMGSSSPLTTNTFTDVGDITGGPLSDTFNFNFATTDVVGGSISGNVDGGGADPSSLDSLNFSNFNTQLDVNLQFGTATPIGGTFSNITYFVGNDGLSPNEIHGRDANTNWTLFNSATATAGNLIIASFGDLVGGSGSDKFTFELGSTYTGNIDGGFGVNTLDYSNQAGPVTVNFQNHTASRLVGTFANIQNVIGSQSHNDTIVGPDASWIIDGTNSGSVNGITFSSFENLVGSPQTDTFTFKDGGAISGNLDGGGGPDTLDYSQLTTPVTINFANHTATGIGGTFSNITAFTAPPGGFNIVGPDTPTTWTISGVNTVSALGFTFTASSLTGGSDVDTFVFLSGGQLDGKIDGGGGNNLLTYAGNAGDVVVNLALHQATRVAAKACSMSKMSWAETQIICSLVMATPTL